jgi:hypothetical protein
LLTSTPVTYTDSQNSRDPVIVNIPCPRRQTRRNGYVLVVFPPSTLLRTFF